VTQALRAEILKSRNSFAVWLSVAGTIANVLIFFTLTLFDAALPVSPHPWRHFIIRFYEGISFMMLPLYVVILASLVTFMEHRSNTWRQLYALPVSRWQYYWSKQLFIVLLFVGAHLLFIAGMLGSGLLLGLLRPGTGSLGSPLPVTEILSLAWQTFVSVLGMMAWQYWISLRFQPFIIPLTIGIIGFVVVSLMGPAWPGNYFIPYAYPVQYMPHHLGETEVHVFCGRPVIEWLSLGYFALFTFLGYRHTRRLDVR